jgi:hypothetical protein
LCAVQVITHLFLLSISAHSGQVAIPWMMNRGMTLFGNLLEQHAPGSSILAAVAQRVLPFAPVDVVRLLNIALVIAGTLLIYALAARLSGDARAGLAAAVVWAWWEPVYGNVLTYFDTLLGLLLTLAALVWLALQERKPAALAPLAAGLILGAATLAKQHAWAAVFLFALWLAAFRPRGGRWRDPLLLLAAAFVLPALAMLAFAFQGDFERYVYWNWGFNLSGLMTNPPYTGDFIRKVLLTNVLAPAFALLALRERQPVWVLVILLYAAGSATLFPRTGEIHVMGQLPILSVMSAVVIVRVIAGILQEGATRKAWTRQSSAELTLAGVALALLVGWGWTGAAAYGATPLGRGATPGHDEFIPLAARLRALAESEDTLFVLPQTDSTPQLHPMSEMLPPGLWIKGWFWYLQAPGIQAQLLAEWENAPPTFVVVFPDLVVEGVPGIEPLVAFVEANYTAVETVEDVVFHGDAVIYRHRD